MTTIERGEIAEFENAIAVENRLFIEWNVVRAEGYGSDRKQEIVDREGECLAFFSCYGDGLFIRKSGFSFECCHLIAANWCSRTSIPWPSVVETCPEIIGSDILLDAVRPAIEAPLAPTGKIECGLSKGFRRVGSSVHGYAANTPAAFHHQHVFAELCGLNCRAPPRFQ